MDVAKGRYLAFLDSDDIWHPEYLEVMNRHIMENTDDQVAIYFGSYRRMDEFCCTEILPPYIYEGTLTYRKILRHCPIFPSVAIVDTQKLHTTIRFNETLKSLRDDYAYWLTIMQPGLKAIGYADVLGDYRMRNDSMTASKIKMIKPQWNIYRKVLDFNVLKSCWYLFCWGLNGLKKYQMSLSKLLMRH